MDVRFKSDKLRFSRISKQVKGKEILDIGSTEGFVHQLLQKAHPDKKFYTLDASGKADFKVDLDNPGRISKKFDTIIAGEVIEHLASPLKFVSYCASLLKKGGRLIITTPNATGLQYLLDPSWCVYYKDYRGHTQTFTIEMLRRMCQDSRLQVTHTEYINAFWITNPLQYLSFFIRRLRPDLLIVAELDK